MEYDPYNPRGLPDNARKAAARKATKPKAAMPKRQAEAFSEDETGEATANTVAAVQLRAFIERVERLEEDKKAIAEDIKEVYGEMKATGFDTKAVRKIVAMRKKDAAERQEEEAIIDLYKNALGMV